MPIGFGFLSSFLDQLRVQVYGYEGTDVVHSHDAEVFELGAAYLKKKEITVGWLFGHDKVKVAFDLKSGHGGVPVYAKLYVNDVEKGTPQSESGISYVTKTETLANIADSDKIQLFLHGLTGINLISVNFGAGVIYKHSGLTTTIISQFATPKTTPQGMTLVNGDLMSVNSGTYHKVYVHDGISSAIKDSFNTPASQPRGLTFDGTNLISSDQSTDRIYVHDGISGGIKSNFASPAGNPRGLAFDGTNLISLDGDTKKIYVHDGIGSAILSSFDAPGIDYPSPQDLEFDGTDLISSDSGTDRFYVHDGISSTVKYSFVTPGSGARGITYYPGLSTVYAKNFRIIGEVDPMAEKAAVFENTL